MEVPRIAHYLRRQVYEDSVAGMSTLKEGVCNAIYENLFIICMHSLECYNGIQVIHLNIF